MFKVTARTVLELGSELISSDIIAFYELIKNGFDAKTTEGVDIKFNIVLRRNSYLSLRARTERARKIALEESKKSTGTKTKTVASDTVETIVTSALRLLATDADLGHLQRAQSLLEQASTYQKIEKALEAIYNMNSITVSDRGSGMSIQDLQNSFLVIGTPSRKKEVDAALQNGASETPYLGEKGIGRLSAMRLGEKLRVETSRANDVAMNCLTINWADFAEIDAMLSDIKITPEIGESKPEKDWSGTRIIIGDLSEDWTLDRVKQMANHDFSRLIDPFLDPKMRPRIGLYWNEERISIPWMPKVLLDKAHATASGTYQIIDGVPELKCTVEVRNLGFPHPIEVEPYLIPVEDLTSALIGTSAELPESALQSIGPFSFQTYWFNRKLLTAIEGIGDLSVVREQQQRWSGILLFRDSFRVFPYGENEDDWLGLDRKALARSGYTLNKLQFVGRVEISRVLNPLLVDQTNREGLRETPEQQIFVGIMQYVIQDLLFRSMKHVERQYKGQKIDLSDAKKEVASLDSRAKSALGKLRKIAPPGDPSIEELQQTLFEFSEFAERARQRIEEVEQESRQMIEMAGVGLMVEVVAHELARASENALENLEALRGKNIPVEVKAKLDSLRAQMKSLGKRVRILDPMSISGRQRIESFDLKELIKNTIDAHEAQFERHKIFGKLNFPENPVFVRTVKGMVVQIIENLISNSKYWLDLKSNAPASFKPKIEITLLANPPTIIFEDNGPGIAPENSERVFRSFFSLKEKTKRRGLGLFIAKECAEYMGGTLVLDLQPTSSSGRLSRFILELPQNTAK
jgi:signal transduction histidine kinase